MCHRWCDRKVAATHGAAYGGLGGPMGPVLLSSPPGCEEPGLLLLPGLFSLYLEGFSSLVNGLLSHSFP